MDTKKYFDEVNKFLDNLTDDEFCDLIDKALDESNNVKPIGYCKECGSAIYQANEIPEYKGVYECPKCYHPHNQNELWHSIPEYLK
jgi:predicted RNA-binding Zn-ribbon protein involved in translation (DUF1610 family)